MEEDLICFNGSDEKQSQVISFRVLREILQHFVESLNLLIKKFMLCGEILKLIIMPIAFAHDGE